jgi:hypothetical protein
MVLTRHPRALADLTMAGRSAGERTISRHGV